MQTDRFYRLIYSLLIRQPPSRTFDQQCEVLERNTLKHFQNALRQMEHELQFQKAD